VSSRERHHARDNVGLDVVQDVFFAFEAADDDGEGGVGKNGECGASHVEKTIEYQQHTDAFRGRAYGGESRR
jgi:hypothetical protein